MPQKGTPTILYQPSEVRIARLWSDPQEIYQHPYYDQARTLLATVNDLFRATLKTRWQAWDAGRIYHISPGTPPACTCGSYKNDPLIVRFGKEREMHHRCPHVLAYLGYREILTDTWGQVRASLPGYLRDKEAWRTGRWEPVSAEIHWQFAEWLHNWVNSPVTNTPIVRPPERYSPYA